MGNAQMILQPLSATLEIGQCSIDLWLIVAVEDHPVFRDLIPLFISGDHVAEMLLGEVFVRHA